jgi:hypothetical protein
LLLIPRNSALVLASVHKGPIPAIFNLASGNCSSTFANADKVDKGDFFSANRATDKKIRGFSEGLF